MTKIVINTNVGGFGLSNEAIFYYAKLKKINISLYEEVSKGVYKLYKKEVGKSLSEYSYHFCILPVGCNFPIIVNNSFIDSNSFNPEVYDFGEGFQFRSDPCLVETVNVLDDLASHKYCTLKIVEIPDDVKWHIDELEDGREIIRENARSWS